MLREQAIRCERALTTYLLKQVQINLSKELAKQAEMKEPKPEPEPEPMEPDIDNMLPSSDAEVKSVAKVKKRTRVLKGVIRRVIVLGGTLWSDDGSC